MLSYLFFLKINGLNNLISREGIYKNEFNLDYELKEVVIEVQNGNIVEKRIGKKPIFLRRSIVRYPINIIYSLFILLLLLFPVVYIIVISIMEKSLLYLTTNIIIFLFVIQYIVGYIYYHSTNFDRFIINNRDYDWYLFYAYLLSTIFAMMLSVLSFILLLFSLNINIFDKLYAESNIVGKIFIVVVVFMYMFYSYSILLYNLVTFSSIFIIQSLKLKYYKKELERYIDESPEELTINSIMEEYTELKENHAQLIKDLNNIFSTFTILGLLSTYFISLNIGSSFVTILDYINITLFLAAEAIYLYVINRLKAHVNDMADIVNSPKFINRFLNKVILREFEGEMHDDVSFEDNIRKIYKSTDQDSILNFIRDMVFRSVIKCQENAESLDLLILNGKLGEEWERFQLLGFNVDDTTILKKLFAIISGLLMLLEFSDKYI